MGRQAKELNFKPYVGLFFQFTAKIKEKPNKASVGRKIYGNQLRLKVKYTSLDDVPGSILIVEEKRNHVRFLGPDNEYYWTSKTNIEPLLLPEYKGSPVPLLNDFKTFLIYCTDTKISNFKTEKMTSMAMDLLPKIELLIQSNQANCFDMLKK
jgi:hypothetical protein